ncbi:MAG: hypothetical protein M0Z61_08580 [Nitrospiraceae bacterium]|nr:hypothetical protein [Nitrospiraceae bacterium]
MKRVIFIIISLTTVLISVIFINSNKNPIPILLGGALAIFMVYALWNPPKKYKDYSLSDQEHATSRALGGSGMSMTDLLDIKPKNKKPRKNE